MRLRSIGCAALLLGGCANAGHEPPATDDAPITPADGPVVVVDSVCPAGQLAVEVTAAGEVRCAAPEAPVKAAIDASCGVYLGWRDSCNGCALPPTKSGRAGATCTRVGVDTTCTTPVLGGVTVPLLGLNFDGDVGDDDKLFGTLHCALPPAPTTSMSPCAPGEFVTGLVGSSWTCASLADVAVAYARESCSLYLGWRDSCSGCTLPPSKWGRASSTSCQNGLGLNNTCSTTTIVGETVSLFGLNFDGNVNDDDKLHFGLHCESPPAPMGTPTTKCPPGQFVTGTKADGSFSCGSPVAAVHAYVTQRCTLFAGHRDNCNGCLTAPAKWGSAKVGACALGVGLNNTCGKFTLGTSVDLFGLNLAGDVDGNDTLYVGLRCE